MLRTDKVIGIVLVFISLSSSHGQLQNTVLLNQGGTSTTTSHFVALDGALQNIDKNIRSIYQDKKGNYWIGTNGMGVYRYTKEKLTQFAINDGLADNQVTQIQEDDQGNIWLGAGVFSISKFDVSRFTIQSKPGFLQTGGVADWKSKSNDLWFYAGAGVFKYSNPSLIYLPFNPAGAVAGSNDAFTLSRYAVYSILKDKNGNIWCGTQAEGVCKYDGKAITWIKEKGLADFTILAIFEDSRGILWFGNNGKGLFRYDGKTLTNITEERGLSNAEFRFSGKKGPGTLARVYSITEDNLGTLWIGTVDAGVWRFEGNNLVNYTTREGLTSDAVNTIFKDNKGDLWFGTDADGICRFNGTTFTEWKIK